MNIYYSGRGGGGGGGGMSGRWMYSGKKKIKKKNTDTGLK